MDRFRLKNVIILILILTDLALMGALVYRRTVGQSVHIRGAEELSALLAADGIQLDPGIIPQTDPPEGRSLTRDTALDRKAAAFLLGKGLTSFNQGGGVYSYTSSAGAALFRDNGSFDAAGTLSSGSGETRCREFCEEFHYASLVSRLDEEGSGTMTAVRQFGGLPVFNASITFTLNRNVLVSVSGTLLPETFTVTEDTVPLSALAALTAFQLQVRETGAVATSITDLYLCYELQSTAASPMSLVPAWCLVTDTVKYYVNCFTGAVSQI